MDMGWHGVSRWPSAEEAREPGQWDGVERRDVVQRRRRSLYRFMDRRGGFDRRRRSLLALLLDKPSLLVGALVLLNVLSLVDGFYSMIEVSLGIAHEGNPLLAAAAGRDPLLAVLLKVAAMAFATVVIWLNRRRRAVLVTGLIGLLGYAALVIYHRYVLSVTGLL
ncbi:hypothetical protein EG835_11375 [bacterium]|nr:hypothetical protein [bacterium]